MADTQETIADIIAEMRNRAKRPDFVSQDVLKSCADRLDAAHKRERNRNFHRFATAHLLDYCQLSSMISQT